MPENNIQDRLPPGQQLVAPGKWPVIGEREPAPHDGPWTLSVSGAVENNLMFSIDELRSLPQTKQTMDIHCVTRWSKYDVVFSGVLLSDILRLAAPDSTAQFVSFNAHSLRNHSTSLTLNDAVSHKTLIALDVDGAPIPTGHGGPIRNILSGKYFYKCVKWLKEIELLNEDRLGMWEAGSGYHNVADPWKEQRYMVPTIDRRQSIKLIETRNFSDQDLRSIDASKRDLAGLNAENASLRDANFSDAVLTKANFCNSNLSNAHFRNANLRGARFVGADVEGTDFSGADLRDADFTDSSMIGASFCFGENNEIAATIDETTILPASVIAPLFPTQLAYVKQRLGV